MITALQVIALLISLCVPVSGNARQPDYITHQGVELFLDAPYTVDPLLVEDIIDITVLMIEDWGLFKADAMYKRLPGLHISFVSWKGYMEMNGRGGEYRIDGDWIRVVVDVVKFEGNVYDRTCPLRGSLVHELIHFFGWKILKNPMGDHAPDMIWKLEDGTMMFEVYKATWKLLSCGEDKGEYKDVIPWSSERSCGVCGFNGKGIVQRPRGEGTSR